MPCVGSHDLLGPCTDDIELGDTASGTYEGNYGRDEYNSKAFYTTLWGLVAILAGLAACALLGLLRIGRIPPPEKRPTEEQRQ